MSVVLLSCSSKDKYLVECENPRAYGKGLTANRSGQWRYRIGDYRLICSIEDERLIILALSVGHRSDIYKQYYKAVNNETLR